VPPLRRAYGQLSRVDPNVAVDPVTKVELEWESPGFLARQREGGGVELKLHGQLRVTSIPENVELRITDTAIRAPGVVGLTGEGVVEEEAVLEDD